MVWCWFARCFSRRIVCSSMGCAPFFGQRHMARQVKKFLACTGRKGSSKQGAQEFNEPRCTNSWFQLDLQKLMRFNEHPNTIGPRLKCVARAWQTQVGHARAPLKSHCCGCLAHLQSSSMTWMIWCPLIHAFQEANHLMCTLLWWKANLASSWWSWTLTATGNTSLSPWWQLRQLQLSVALLGKANSSRQKLTTEWEQFSNPNPYWV